MTAEDFFIQAGGFAVQTAPIALIMCVPFEDANLKLPRAKLTALLLAIVFALAAIFGVWEQTQSENEYVTTFGNIYMVGAVMLTFGVCFGLVKARILNKTLITVILVHYAAIIFTLDNIIFRVMGLPPSEKNVAYSVYDLIIIAVVTAVTLPPIYAFLKNVVRPAISSSDRSSIKRGFAYVSSALFLYSAVMMFFDFGFSRSDFANIGIIVFFSALIITDGILYYMFFFETKLVMENIRLTDRIRSFDEQYRNISRSIDESRRIRHDVRHHLSAISEMIKRGQTRELSEYLEVYVKNYSEADDNVLSGYHALDNILRYYIARAKDEGISV